MSTLGFKFHLPRLACAALLACAAFVCALPAAAGENAVSGWLNWRGPHQNGTSDETNLPETWAVGGENNLWTRDIPGQSAPVIANGKLYIMGMKGENDANLQEGIFCLDAASGKTIWEDCHTDFLSDTIYLRYASSAPAVDPETGHIFTLGSEGFMSAYEADGKLLWQHSMMDELGFMTFPNGRTGRPAVEGPLVIVSCTTANWGANGPGANRFYAFDKKTGELVWASNTAARPHENSFTTPVFDWVGNKRMMYVCGGDGNLYGLNAYTGETIWYYPMCHSGMTSTAIVYNHMIIAVHGRQNYDNAGDGRMICLKVPENVAPVDGAPAKLEKSAEVWRCDVRSFGSSPVLANDRLYITDDSARLCCVDVKTGEMIWKKALSNEVVTSSIVYADGKIYAPVLDGNFLIVKPGDTEESTKILSKVKLDARNCGSPAVCDGRVYIQSGLAMDGKLYCIGKKDANQKASPWPVAEKHAPGALAKFIAAPADLLMHPGDNEPLRLIPCDKDGLWLSESATGDAKKAAWVRFIPPTAKVKAEINGNVVDGVYKADANPAPSAGALKATLDNAVGVTRGRIMSNLPIKMTFEKAVLQPSETDPAVKFAYPPLPWIGARFRWEIREKDGVNCLYKTVENKLFQRAMTFISTPEMSNYTVQADVRSDGEKKKFIVKMSEVGVINQRYIVILKGGSQELEINSNFERIRMAVPFQWTPDTWYTIKSKVDIDAASGSGVVRAKAWKKGDPEPEKWTIEYPHKIAHKQGSPGVFAFSPTDVPVWINNIEVTPNAK